MALTKFRRKTFAITGGANPEAESYTDAEVTAGFQATIDIITNTRGARIAQETAKMQIESAEGRWEDELGLRKEELMLSREQLALSKNIAFFDMKMKEAALNASSIATSKSSPSMGIYRAVGEKLIRTLGTMGVTDLSNDAAIMAALAKNSKLRDLYQEFLIMQQNLYEMKFEDYQKVLKAGKLSIPLLGFRMIGENEMMPTEPYPQTGEVPPPTQADEFLKKYPLVIPDEDRTE